MRCSWIIVLAVLGVSACTKPGSGEFRHEILIRHVQIVSPDGATTGDPTDVLVRDGLIFSIGVNAVGQASDSAETLDATGHFLSPGLIDGHTHLNEVPGMTFDHEQAYPQVAADARFQIPRSYLYHGFTTVVDLNAHPDTINDWNSKEVRPLAYFCGASPVHDGYPMSFMPKPTRYQMMPYFLFDDSRAAEFPNGYDPSNHSPSAVVERIRRDGGICVKTHYERGFGRRRDLPVPTINLIRELVKEAHNVEMPVLMHANSESAQAFGIETGIDAFAHGMWTWEDRTTTSLNSKITAIVDTMVDREIALQPTIQVLYGEQDIHDPDYLSSSEIRHVLPISLIQWYATDDGQWWRVRMLKIPIVAQFVDEGRWEELDAPPIARVSAVTGYFAHRGGRLIFGSDTPSDPTFANPPGLNGRLEMDRWIAAGVTPTQLFQSATIGNAEFFGLADQTGTVEVGKKADLLITRESPLDGVSAYDTIEYVILGGKAIKRSSLSAISAEP